MSAERSAWTDARRAEAQAKPLRDLAAENERLREALRLLYEEVEMAEAVGICLPDRTASLRAGELLAAVPEERG